MGEHGQEPVYGLEGRWIPESRGEGARALGCHLLAPEVLLWGRAPLRSSGEPPESVPERRLVAATPETAGPEMAGAGFLQALRCLLEERCTIAPLESLAQAYRGERGPAQKRLRAMRLALGPRLVTPWLNEHDTLVTVSLTHPASRRLRRSSARPGWTRGLVSGAVGPTARRTGMGRERARHRGPAGVFQLAPRPFRTFASFHLRRIPVLSFEEIPIDAEVESVGLVGSRLHPLAGTWPRRRVDVNGL